MDGHLPNLNTQNKSQKSLGSSTEEMSMTMYLQNGYYPVSLFQHITSHP